MADTQQSAVNKAYGGSVGGGSGSDGSTSGSAHAYAGPISTYRAPSPGTGVADQQAQQPAAQQDQPKSTYHPYVGSHPYDDGYVRPSQADLDAENARRSGGYGDAAALTDALAEENIVPEDTSYVKTDLLNGEENGKTAAGLLKSAGYDTENAPAKLDVPGQVALPNRVDLPNVDLPNRVENPNVTLPDQVALPDDVNLPRELALPDEVALPDEIKFEDALARAGVDVGQVDRIDTAREEAILSQMTEAQRQQAILAANRAVEQGTTNLQRSLQDAQGQFVSQRNQIDIDTQRALDNQALYAEARGDRGGIGQAQYNDIQNTAATNRLMVQQEQTKLATDTARQIADLRSQGEFEKANQLLTISQNYLSQLMDLYTWAKETNVSIDEFNLQVAQWEENYKLNLIDAELGAQASNLNLAQMRMQQGMNRYNAAYQQENSLYNARWNQAQQLYEDAYNQANSQYNARWNQAQQLWQNEYNQENSLYNARWNQATDLFNAAYNQENSQFEARRNAANDYFNNQLNAANYGLNASKAALEAQINAANATGAFSNGTPTYVAQQNAREILAASGQALLEQGIIPTAEQLAAMGMTASQAAEYTGGDLAGLTNGTGVTGTATKDNAAGTLVTRGNIQYLNQAQVNRLFRNAQPGGYIEQNGEKTRIV